MMIRTALVLLAACAASAAAPGADDSFGDPLPKNALQRLGTTRLCYSGVADLRYLPDGRGLVAAGGRIDLWDLAAGRLETSLVVSRRGIASAALRRDGKVLLVADGGGDVREWDLQQRRELRSWPTGQKSLRLACYSPDETRVLTCGAVPPTLKQWDLASAKELVSIRGTMHSFSDAIYGPGGSTAFAGGSAGSDAVLAQYDLASGKLLKEWFKDYCVYERCLALSPDSQRLLVGSRHQATEWRLDDYKMLKSFRGHLGHAVVAVAYGRNPDELLTGSRDGSIRRWERLKGEVLTRWWAHPAYATRVQVSPDGKWALSYGSGVVAECSIADGSPRLKWERHAQPVRCVTMLSDGRAVSGSDDGSLRVWDILRGRSLRTIRGENLIPQALAVSPDGKRVAAACKDGVLREYALDDGRLLRELKGHTGYARSLTYGPAGLISSGDDGSIRFWRAAGTEPMRVIEGDLDAKTGHRGGVLSVALSPDNELLLSGGRDGTMRLWRVRDGRQAATFDEHRGWVEVVAFAGGVSQAVSASRDGSIRVWNLQCGKLAREIRTDAAVEALACSADGSRAYLGGRGAVTCWDLASGKQAFAFKGHSRAITALAVDGTHLVSASEDTTLLVWPSQVKETKRR